MDLSAYLTLAAIVFTIGVAGIILTQEGFACNGATTWAGPLPLICRVGCCSGS